MPTPNENRDPLTGVWNWKYVSNLLPRILDHNSEVALILIEIDRMKSLNEERGRGVGNETLVGIAREIEANCGASSLVFRAGGDEFGVVLYEASLKEAREIAETLRAARSPFAGERGENEVGKLTFSLGIAHFPNQVSNSENLLRAADVALLKAKRGGRLPDSTSCIGRNRAMTFGDFLDEFPEQSARFLK